MADMYARRESSIRCSPAAYSTAGVEPGCTSAHGNLQQRPCDVSTQTLLTEAALFYKRANRSFICPKCPLTKCPCAQVNRNSCLPPTQNLISYKRQQLGIMFSPLATASNEPIDLAGLRHASSRQHEPHAKCTPTRLHTAQSTLVMFRGISVGVQPGPTCCFICPARPRAASPSPGNKAEQEKTTIAHDVGQRYFPWHKMQSNEPFYLTAQLDKSPNQRNTRELATQDSRSSRNTTMNINTTATVPHSITKTKPVQSRPTTREGHSSAGRGRRRPGEDQHDSHGGDPRLHFPPVHRPSQTSRCAVEPERLLVELVRLVHKQLRVDRGRRVGGSRRARTGPLCRQSQRLLA